MPKIFEHFDGSLPAWMTPITQGDGAVSVADSRLLMGTSAATAGSDAFAVAFPFDRSLGRYQRLSFMMRSTPVTSNNPRAQVRIVHSAATPGPATAATYAGITLCRTYLNFASSVWSGVMAYWDSAGQQQTWREATQSFASGGGAGTPPITTGDSWQVIIDWDEPNNRLRMGWVHVATGTTFASEPHGPKLFALTDWVSLADVQHGSSSTLWIVVGWPDTDITMASGAAVEVDFLTHEWADELTWTTANESDTGSGVYNIRAWSSVAGHVWLPKSRTELAIPVGGSGDWDGEAVHWRGIVRDVDGTLWMAYQGSAIGGVSSGIGIASASSIDGTWTKFASNPVIADSPGDRSFVGQVTLTCDRTDPDPARRWKMTVVGLSDVDSKRRVFLYYASQPDTTSWTLDGTLLDWDSGESTDGVHLLMAPQYFAGRWHLYYLAVNVSGSPWSVYRAIGATLRAGAFTKSQAVDYFPNANGVETTISSASSTSRTVTVGSTTGFARDALIMYDQDGTVANWRLGRVRKVISSTQLELYHLMPGISTAGVLRTVLKGKQAPTTLRPDGDTWTFFGSAFSVFSGHASYAANYEGGCVWSTPHPAVAPTVDWPRTPGLLLGRNGNNGSSENWGFSAPPVDPFTQRVTTNRRRRQPRRRR